MLSEEIVIDNPETLLIPRRPATGNPDYIKHVRCEGARFHVISYILFKDRAMRVCSEKRCIVNEAYNAALADLGALGG